ncbi:hypothetical protein D3C75_762050 [compost metagenome]
MLNRFFAVTNVDVGRLRQSRQQLVRGVSGKNGWPSAIEIFRVATHRKAAIVHRIEAGVGVPGFIKVNLIDALRQ